MRSSVVPGASQLGSQASILIITAVLTAFYMGRQIFLVFWGTQRDT